jgi:uncharacterized protein
MAAKRIIVGYSSTWDLDLGGDKIERGSFARSIAAWKAGEREIALVDTHDSGSVRNVLGRLVDAEEDAKGLLTRFELVDGDDAAEALYRIDAGAVRGLSIGYRLPKEAVQVDDDTGIRIISEVELEEVSLVLFPMNPKAVITRIGGKMVGRKHEPRKPLRLRPDTVPDFTSSETDEDKLVDPPDMTIYNALMRQRAPERSAFDDLPPVQLGANDLS